jgi:hypothetical protein
MLTGAPYTAGKRGLVRWRVVGAGAQGNTRPHASSHAFRASLPRVPYTKAPCPVSARPTIRVLISFDPSYE